MSVEISKLKSRVSAFSNSLDDLESVLDTLFSQTLPETVVNLEPLQQAKLQTDVPYVIYDLVFMYLKLKGIDPKTHPVIPELERIRQYFDKISKTENPPTRKNEVDKEAAGRFIKNAISSVQWKKTAAEEEAAPEASTSSARVPVKVTSKMLERAEYERGLKEKAAAGESEEEDLQVFNEDGEGSMDVDGDAPTTSEPAVQNKRKRQRGAVDPFAGYGEGSGASKAASESKQGSSDPTPAETAPSTPQPKKKKAKQSTEGPTDGSIKKKKKGKKKADS
ncbi:hypothetical protein EST38_g1269 [Candolleomyces aberdarensis]|uniref:Exosome complex protein n=1 Tax=Candolleomyces aberdarensis TaxID=2316362 RepID=A0A4Q2DYY2_9AGAR|nr:hypothetical protein EST38_g1269 [Candolleomyces aberdarensis]